MTFLEPIIFPIVGVAAGFGLTKATKWLNKQKVAKAILKAGPGIARVYDVIDPLLASNLATWKGSQVQEAFTITVQALSDGQLTDTEVKLVATHLAEKFLPQAAADKVQTYASALNEPVAVTASKVVNSAVTGALTSTAAINQIQSLFSKK
jgi:hypothetical protein